MARVHCANLDECKIISEQIRYAKNVVVCECQIGSVRKVLKLLPKTHDPAPIQN